MERFIRSMAAVALVAALGACEVATGPGDHATGVVFLNAQGNEVARFQRQGSATGGIVVQAGTTAEFQVRVLLRNGEQQAVDGAAFAIGEPFVFLGPSFAVATLTGVNRVRVQGVGTTTHATTLQMALFHGGHFEFDVVVPLRVQ